MTGGPHNQRQYKSTGALTRFLVVSPENPRPPFLPRRPTRFALIHYSYPPNQPTSTFDASQYPRKAADIFFVFVSLQ